MVGEDDETTLVEEIGVALDDKGVELVAVLRAQSQVALEELLPKDWQLPLNQVKDTELHRLHALLLR